MDQITEQDKELGQHLAKMVTAQDTPNYRRVLADNEKYIAAEIAKVRKDARVSSDADKARIAAYEQALQSIADSTCCVTCQEARLVAQSALNQGKKNV